MGFRASHVIGKPQDKNPRLGIDEITLSLVSPTSCRGVGHLIIMLRLCALGSGVGFCELWEYSFGHETVFPWGCKLNSVA